MGSRPQVISPARSLGREWAGLRASSPRPRQAHRLRSALLLLCATTACSPSTPRGFGPASTWVEDTGWDGTHDPLSWLRDYWTSTYEICQPPEPFERWGLQANLYADWCRDALIADLKIDEEDFAAENYYCDYWENLAEGAYILLGADQGTVQELTEIDDSDDLYYVRDPFIEQIQLAADELGQDQVRQVLYNMVMSTILQTRTGAGPGAANFNPSTRILNYNGFSGVVSHATLLVHEATHGWQNVGHDECPEGHVVDGDDYSGQKVCDDDWDGAWGFQAASGWLLHVGFRENGASGDTESLWEAERAAAMILAE
jgi:hypothetical protein